MLGGSLSYTLDRSPGSGVNVGLETSFVFLAPSLFWHGAYVDGTYATDSRELRLSIGPEIGLGPVGMDAGYLLKLAGAGSAQHGLSLRWLLTTGVAAFYFRSGWLFGSRSDWFGEFGLLLKFPIPIGNPRSQQPGDHPL